MKRSKYVTCFIAAAFALGTLGGCGNSNEYNRYDLNIGSTEEDQDKPFDIFSYDTQKKVQEIEKLIDQKFYFDIDNKTREKMYYKGILAGLGDPYSTYYTKEEMDAINEEDSGEYVGIGATVSKNPDSGAIYVVKPLRGSPAAEAGLQADDIFIEIDGVELTTDTGLEEAVKMIRGSKNSTAKLKMYRDGEDDYIYFDIPRRVVQNISVEYEMLENGFGYISVEQFIDNTSAQFREGVDYLTSNGAKALIIDMRDNPGGFTNQATGMLDYLIEDKSVAEGADASKPGRLIYMVDKHDTILWEDYCKDGHSVELPMAVLINGNSASSSEIFAGGMQDYKKAVLVGTKSYGKGIVQITYPLEDGSGVKLTVASYFLPTGRNIHGDGLVPDVESEMDVKLRRRTDLPHNEDVQLLKAIEELGGDPLP